MVGLRPIRKTYLKPKSKAKLTSFYKQCMKLALSEVSIGLNSKVYLCTTHIQFDVNGGYSRITMTASKQMLNYPPRQPFIKINSILLLFAAKRECTYSSFLLFYNTLQLSTHTNLILALIVF